MVNVLQSVKDYLGIEEDDTSFDGAITAHIDVSIFTLGQILSETPEYTADTDSESIRKKSSCTSSLVPSYSSIRRLRLRYRMLLLRPRTNSNGG